MKDITGAKEIRVTEDVFQVLALLKEGWLLHKVASHQDKFKFLMIRV